MSKNILVAPSLLACDFGRMGDEIKRIEDAGASILHIDVMDGHFVPNITIGVCVVESIKKISKIPLDVHLMIDNPAYFAGPFINAGADFLTFHLEATTNASCILKDIRKMGAKSGISIKPKTGVLELKPYLADADMILIMTVEPGFGGQKFMNDCVEKIKVLRGIYSGFIEVDGGITKETASLCRDAGADVLVAGTAIFRQDDVRQAVRDIRGY